MFLEANSSPEEAQGVLGEVLTRAGPGGRCAFSWRPASLQEGGGGGRAVAVAGWESLRPGRSAGSHLIGVEALRGVCGSCEARVIVLGWDAEAIVGLERRGQAWGPVGSELRPPWP